MYQSADSLHQKLGDILLQFSKAGISVVEFRDYYNYVDCVLAKPIDPALFRELYHKLQREYGVLVFQLKLDAPVIRIVPYVRQKSRLYKYRLPLAVATAITVFLTGLGLSQGLRSEALSRVLGIDSSLSSILLDAILYTFVFLVTLLSHELGHLFVSKKSGIDTEGPILIPAPPIQLGFIGTLGAVIFTKTPPPSKRDLALLGLSGPLSGIVMATIFGVIGLYMSPIIPLSVAQELARAEALTPVQMTSLGLYLLSFLRAEEGVIVFHPILFVAYVMYLVTFLNLLPLGQLDGGHVVRSAVSAKTFHTISTITPLLLVLAGITLLLVGVNGLYLISMGLLALILYFILGRGGHPGAANQYDTSRCNACLIVYAILLVLTLPIPVP